jgi:hypothetical protein
MSGSGGSYARNADPAADSGERAGPPTPPTPHGARERAGARDLPDRSFDLIRPNGAPVRVTRHPPESRISTRAALTSPRTAWTTASEPGSTATRSARVVRIPRPNGPHDHSHAHRAPPTAERRGITNRSEAVATRDAQPHEPTPGPTSMPGLATARGPRPAAAADGGRFRDNLHGNSFATRTPTEFRCQGSRVDFVTVFRVFRDPRVARALTNGVGRPLRARGVGRPLRARGDRDRRRASCPHRLPQRRSDHDHHVRATINPRAGKRSPARAKRSQTRDAPPHETTRDASLPAGRELAAHGQPRRPTADGGDGDGDGDGGQLHVDVLRRQLLNGRVSPFEHVLGRRALIALRQPRLDPTALVRGSVVIGPRRAAGRRRWCTSPP